MQPAFSSPLCSQIKHCAAASALYAACATIFTGLASASSAAACGRALHPLMQRVSPVFRASGRCIAGGHRCGRRTGLQRCNWCRQRGKRRSASGQVASFSYALSGNMVAPAHCAATGNPVVRNLALHTVPRVSAGLRTDAAVATSCHATWPWFKTCGAPLLTCGSPLLT